MLRFDKDPEGGTAADISGRQSPFVYPGEELIRELRAHPAKAVADAREALRRSAEEWTRTAADCAEKIAEGSETAQAVGRRVSAFGDRLPGGVFGVGNGEDQLLPLGLLTEKIRQAQSALGKLGVGLYQATERLSAGIPPEAMLTAELLENEELTEEIRRLRRMRSELLSVTDGMAEEIDRFLRGTVEAFFLRAEQAADLTHKGAEMRFSALRRLCGEFRNSADRFAAVCEGNRQKLESEIRKKSI